MQSTLIAGIAVLAGAAAFAQSNQGTITGTVSDPAGAVVAGAVIEVKNVGTGVVSRAGTSATGNYVISVPPGTYELTVQVPGFKKYVQQNVPVVVATDTRKDVSLEVGQNTEVVTVEETAPLLKTESGEVSHRVTTNDADQLPVLTISGGGPFGSIATSMGQIRNPLQVSTLLPGVAFMNDQALVVNGMPSNSESIRIEGQDSTGTIWKVSQQLSQGAGVDAIQEVAVQTSNFAAEYGQVGGGYFNFTMKSGTNQLHGSAYAYFVNEALNAGLPYTDAGATNSLKEGQHIRNAVRRTDYGFTLGGPVRIPKLYNGTDKTFFFFNFEQFRENRLISNGVSTVPTDAYRNGDFRSAGCYAWVAAANFCAFRPPITYTSGALAGQPAVDPAGQTLSNGEIFDPQSTHTLSGAQVRDPFMGQQIPLARMDPIFLAVQKYFPHPTNSNLINNYAIPGYVNWQHTTNWSVKMDHSISPTIKISGYVSRLIENSPNANGYSFIASVPTPTSNRNVTTRLNYDHTIRPTVLFHAGIGYIWQRQPTDTPAFDQSTLGPGLHGYPVSNRFPSMSINAGFFGPNLNDFLTGGYSPGVGPPFIATIYEEKPTANANLIWVKGNHTFKYGSELTLEGYPEYSRWRSNGQFNFSNAETADPWQNFLPLSVNNPSGFTYASFMLGQVDQLQSSPFTQTRLGSHQLGLYAQDSWKISRRLTLDLGLRWDYQTYLKEQYGRFQNNSPSTPNPTVGGLPGAGIYEATCHCQFAHNYPYAFGPRAGLAYQINDKTVLRGGAGVTYGLVQTPAGASYQIADFQSYNSPSYGVSPYPNGFPANNPNPNVVWPTFNPGLYPTPAGGLLPPGNAPFFWNPSARPPRTLQWSIGLQRSIGKDLVMEASYVGNRGVWWAAPSMDQYATNGISDADLAAHGLSRNNSADMALLGLPISDPRVVARGFVPAYAGMPPNTTLAQDIRPVPQWLAPAAWLGPAVGKTWYDALQLHGTKRFSHGLAADASFVWSHATDLGTGAETGQFVTGIPVLSDIYNYGINKQLNQLTRPLALVISGSYLTPKLPGDSRSTKVLSQVLHDWQLGWVLRYQSAALIQAPASTNQLCNELLRGCGSFFTSVSNSDNFVAGQNPLRVDPNSKSFDPTRQQLLNSAAWSEPATGQWGTSAPFYSSYRWQRQPAESMSFGRNFHMGKEGRYNLQVRAEFQNIFNRHFYSVPTTTSNPALPPSVNSAGIITGGYGTINTTSGTGAGAVPRSGQAVARFTF